ncbi:Ribose import permease protein RbsC [subsurface metagenome]
MSAKIERIKRMLEEVDLSREIIIIFLFMMLVGFILNPIFLSVSNIVRILTGSVIYIILAVGMTFVIVSGGIDLSIGSILAFTSCLFGFLVKSLSWPVLPVLFLVLVLGTCIGILNGILITKLFLPPFIATLATLAVFRGLSWIIFEGKVYFSFPKTIEKICSGGFLGIPYLIIISIIIVIGASILFSKLQYGRYIKAIGGNSRAAKLSCIPIARYLIITYAIMGFLAALAGFLMITRTDAVQSSVGAGLEFTTIAAVILGGTSLMGGEGSLGGSILGAIIISALTNMMVLGGISFKIEQIVSGVLIIGAILIYSKLFREFLNSFSIKIKGGVATIVKQQH